MLEIRLFGATVVLVDGVQLTSADLGGVKPRQILEMLAANLGTPVSKDRLAEGLWENQPPASYVATLESYVCVLRRGLGAGKGKNSPLATTTNGYVLDPERTRVDLVDFNALMATDASTSADVAIKSTEDALSLVSGELLADDPYAAWAGRERETLSQQLETRCTHAAQLARELGDNLRAVRFSRMAADQGFFTETAWHELMRALTSLGRRSEALRAYADLRAGMLEELGIEPGPTSQRLYMSILRGGPAEERESQDRFEVHTLLRLLRQALEAGSGMDSAIEPGFAEVARLLAHQTA